MALGFLDSVQNLLGDVVRGHWVRGPSYVLLAKQTQEPNGPCTGHSYVVRFCIESNCEQNKHNTTPTSLKKPNTVRETEKVLSTLYDN